jgi:hypothetical protein
VNALLRTAPNGSQADAWSERLRQTLEAYDEPLLRGLASKLFKPRNQWPVDELIERSLTTLGNAPVIDRRLQELDVAERRVLAVIGRSRQPRWGLGNLIELVIALGHADGLPPILHLFESGLLYPCLPERLTRLKSFEQWMTLSEPTGLHVFAPPQITNRVLKENLGLPELSCTDETAPSANATIHEVDGLDWPLRLAVLWQRVAAAPLRRTQQGGFFKRDLERLTLDTLLNDPPSDSLAELPDPAMLAAALAERCGLVEEADGELRAAHLPTVCDQGLHATLTDLFAALPHITTWDALSGWHGDGEVGRGNPFPSAYLLALLLVAQLPGNAWADPDAIETWIVEHHPYWKSDSLRPSRQQSWVPTFLLGLAYQLKMVQAAKGQDGQWRVRLSPLGRWLLNSDKEPTEPPSYPQTLMVQPNLEIIAYRQGLTPALIGHLSLFANWKNVGAACLLTLEPESVYRALQAEQTFDTILQTLNQHGMRPVPPAVIDSLKTWAGKRERITVYPSATLFEFGSADELTDALARGLPATKLSDRLAVVPSENGVDFRHFRLTGTRDYGLPPEKCVEVDADGVSLSIDLARSDLLVETEMQRFAEPLDVRKEGRRLYRVTPVSMAAARESGMGVRGLEEWFTQRTGQPLPAAARLLFIGSQLPASELRKQLVLHVPTVEVADGLLQWPGTRGLIQERLGPVTLVIAEEDLVALRERLTELGVSVQSNP